MKRRLKVGGLVVAALAAGVSVALAVGILNLPGVAVTASHGPWNQGANSTLDITLSGVPDGFDVMNGTYVGWCVEDNGQPDYSGPGVLLLDSTDTDPLVCDPNNYPGYPWDKINYLLNHKNGTVEDIQVAMWLLTGTFSGTFPETPAATAMYDDAFANGGGFLPGPGEIVAVVLCVDGNSGPETYQDTLIELELPPMDYQGCTPGYWRQRHHACAWLATGYSPDALYGDVFGVDDSRDLTLGQAIRQGGGGEDALYRHATAALLNAASPEVMYQYSEAYIIAMVQTAYATGDFEGVKNIFEDANEIYCPLGNCNGGGPPSRARAFAPPGSIN